MTVRSFQAIPFKITLNIIQLTVHIFLSQPHDVYTVKYDICSPRIDLIKHLTPGLDSMFDSFRVLFQVNNIASYSLLHYNLTVQV